MKLIPIDSDSFDCRAELLDLSAEINNFHMPVGEMVAFNIRVFLNVVKRSVKHLASKYKCKQTHVYRAALRLGTPHLYRIPRVTDIKKIRMYVFENSSDLDDIRALENRFFDLKTSDTSPFYNKFPDQDLSYCHGLADALDLNKSTVFQMSLVFSLLHSNLPPVYHNQMAEVFIRFQKDVTRWGKRAVKIRNSIEKTIVSESKIELSDIYDLFEQEDDAYLDV